MSLLTFIETSFFEKRIKALLSDDEYAQFQWFLNDNVEKGDIIPKSGGLRKIRYAIPDSNKGKRGGIRVIYYYVKDEKVYLLLVYTKAEKDNLTDSELAILKQLIKQELKNG